MGCGRSCLDYEDEDEDEDERGYVPSFLAHARLIVSGA
jgi:hypothetical protein